MEKSTFVDESVCILDSESFQVFLKKKENTLTADDKRCLESCKSSARIKLSYSRSRCTKLCTEHKKVKSKRTQTSDFKPQTLRESSSRQKKSETKPLSDQLKTKMKETSKKLQKGTKRTFTKIKSLYKGLKPKRVIGFKCDLKKCDSTLLRCSATTCMKKSMIFGESSRLHEPKLTDSSISDTTTKSTASEEVEEFEN